MNIQLESHHLDILKEVGNIGAGHAATALSVLVQEPVSVSVTAARVCEFTRIADVLGGPEALVVGVFIRVSGDVEGSVLLLMPLASARNLLRRILVHGATSSELSELEVSALAEVGNILSGSYLNAVSAFSSLTVHQSVPAVAMDMAGAILDIGLAIIGQTADAAILIDTEMTQGDHVLQGHLFLLPDPPFAQTLLAALEVRSYG